MDNTQALDSEINEIVVVGLGYVGMTMTAHLLDRGFKVYGVEVRDEILDKLKFGKSYFHEPGLDNILSRYLNTKNFRFGKVIPKNTSKNTSTNNLTYQKKKI